MIAGRASLRIIVNGSWWLWLVPLAAVAWSVRRARLFGPYWGSPMYDPEYAYLVNALNLLQGDPPAHTDHPGTPLQLLMAGIIGLRHRIAGDLPGMRWDVLTHPEAYLRTCWVVLMAIVAIAAMYMGASVRKVCRNTAAGIVAQVAVLSCGVSMASLERVSPEPLLLAYAMVLGAVALRISRPRVKGERTPRWRGAPAMGALMGIAVATKITFAPLGILIAMLPRRIAWKVVAGVFTAAAFLISVIPIRERWPRTIAWLKDLFWGSKRYGGGPRTIVDRDSYAQELVGLLKLEPTLGAGVATFALVILASAGAWMVSRRHRRPALDGELPPVLLRPVVVMVAAVLLSQVAMLLMVAKMPEGRYLIPAVGLLGPGVGAVWCLIMRARTPRIASWALVLVLSAGVLAGAAHHTRRILAIDRARPGWTANRLKMQAAIEELPADARVVTVYGSTGKGVALNFSVSWSGERFAREIGELHPKIIYERNVNRYQHGEQRPGPQELAALAREGRLYAVLPIHRKLEGFTLEPITTIGMERLCRVHAGQLPQ